jgi:hypothetical protein
MWRDDVGKDELRVSYVGEPTVGDGGGMLLLHPSVIKADQQIYHPKTIFLRHCSHLSELGRPTLVHSMHFIAVVLTANLNLVNNNEHERNSKTASSQKCRYSRDIRSSRDDNSTSTVT